MPWTNAAGAAIAGPTSGADIFNGTVGADTAAGLGGNDTLNGGAGDDLLEGGDGNDRIADTLDGGLLRGDGGHDTIVAANAGTTFLDSGLTIDGGAGNDLVSVSGAGIDFEGSLLGATIDGGAGHDMLFGSAAGDVIFAGAGHDTVDAGAGADEVWTDAAGETGFNSVLAGTGDDTVHATGPSDSLFGGDGVDLLRLDLTATDPFNLVSVWSDEDWGLVTSGGGRASAFERLWLELGAGDDSILAADHDDTLRGHAGHDLFDGAAGQDLLDGGEGNDTLRGGEGNDTISADLPDSNGSDLIEAGEGDDLVTSTGGDTLVGGGGTDTLVIDLGESAFAGTFIDDGFGTLFGGDGSQVSGFEAMEIRGSLADDTIAAGGSTDTLIGADGNDSLMGGAGDDSLVGGEGSDTVAFLGQRADYVIVSDGSGMVTVSDIQPADGSEGIDTLSGIELLVFADGTIDTTVNPEAPVADPDGPYAVAEDSALEVPTEDGVLAGDVDPNGLWLQAELVSGTSHGLLQFQDDGSFTYTPDADFSGTDSFVYRAVNEWGLASTPVTVEIAVAAVNDAPVVLRGAPDTATTVGASFTFTLPAGIFGDADPGDALTLSVSLDDGGALPGWLSFDAATGTLSGIAQEADLGTLALRVTATDAAGAAAHDDFTLDVVPPSDAQRFVYAADNGANGRELWVTDGSLAGTGQLLDINPGAAGSDAQGFVALGDGRVLFSADDGASGSELWVTDGTAAGTLRISDANAGAGSSAPREITPLGDGRAVFLAQDDAGGEGLWITDGTMAGTSRIADLVPGGGDGQAGGLVSMGDGRVAFNLVDGTNGRQVWVTDGSAAGTFPVAGLDADVDDGYATDIIMISPGRILFAANDGTTLWTSDGTAAGTAMVSDIFEGILGSDANAFTALGDGRVVFRAAVEGQGSKLWVTDGTAAGTTIFANVGTTSFAVNVDWAAHVPVSLGDGRVIFQGQGPSGGAEPWISDGTPAGTFMLANIAPLTFSSSPASFTDLGDGRILFVAGTSAALFQSNNRELYVTNGELNGTALVENINATSSTASSGITGLTAIGGGRAIFAATDGASGKELWVTDGTAAGTFRLTDANFGAAGSDPAGFTPVGISAEPDNEAPILAIPTADQEAIEDAAFSLTLPAGAFADPDAGDTLTLTATLADGTALPGWLAFDAATRTFSGTPANADEDIVTIRVTATDAAGATVSDDFVLSVTGTNDVPTLVRPIADQLAIEGTAFTFTLPADTFEEIDIADSLTVSAQLADGSALPSWLFFDWAIGAFSGTPGAADVGSLAIEVTATDMTGATVSDVFSINVAAVPQAPTGIDLSATTVAENSALGTVVGLLSAQDADAGDSFTFALIDDPDGVFAVVGQELQVWGSLDFEVATTHAVTIRVTDSAGLTFDRSFTISVGDVAGVLVTGTSGADTISQSVTVAGQPYASLENDTINAGNGNDLVIAVAGDDLIHGGSGLDTLIGNDGHDTLDGGTSADRVVGGAGDDLYVVDSTGDVVSEDGGGGSDTVRASVTHVLAAQVEFLLMTGAGNINGTGNGDDNTIAGTSGNNVLAGLAGADLLDGGDGIDTATYALSGDAVSVSLRTGAGTGGDAEGDVLLRIENLTGSAFDDTLEGDDGDNLLTGGAGRDTVLYGQANAGVTIDLGLTTAQATGAAGLDRFSGIENIVGSGFADSLVGSSTGNAIDGGDGADAIAGGAGADTLDGGAGDDTLDGGTSADWMAGGAGHDLYVVDSSADTATEEPGGGVDTVLASASHSLTAAVEVLILTGVGAIAGTGNALDNLIVGNGAANLLAGLGGADTLDGGAGSDTASYAASATAVLVDLTAGAGLGGDAEGDVLVSVENVTGSAFDDTIVGNAADNVLAGGLGIDLLSYHDGAVAGVTVSLALTTVQDTGGSGLDRISGFENLVGTAFADVLSGSSAGNAIDGREGDDSLAGSSGQDTLLGGIGQDTLNGGSAADRLVGGQGHDYYIADTASDTVLEEAGGGTDTVQASTAWTLGSEVEALLLTGAGNLAGTGNAGDNTILGNAGGNVLAGLAGADLLDGGDGIDTATYAASGAGVTVGLATGTGTGGDAQGDVLIRIENLTGSTQDDRLEGDGGDNILNGGAGIDWVSYANAAGGVVVSLATTGLQVTGGAGTDRLAAFENLEGSAHADLLTGSTAANAIDGGGGNDSIVGGSGSDTLGGGAGEDVFIWLATSNSAAATSDLVTDFVAGSDLLDLGAIDARSSLAGNQAFAFGGQTAAVLANGVTWHEADGITIVQVDVNGNAVADMVIRLAGTSLMITADSFVL